MHDLIHPNAASFRLDGVREEAIVLVHGFTGTPAHFRPLATALNEAGYTVIAPRLAGHCTSIDDMGTTGSRDWVHSALVAYGEAAADHARVHLAGLSMGGLIAIVLAAQNPVASVMTINSPILVRKPISYVAPLFARWRPRVMWEAEPPDLDAEVEEYAIRYDGFPTKSLSGLNVIALRALFAAPAVQAPALVIQSRTDESVVPASATILASRLGGRTDLVWLHRSIHNAVIDRERHLIAESMLSHMGGS